MASTAHLLDLQQLDLTIDRLQARAATLSSGAELDAARREADASEGRLGELRLELDSLDRDGKKVEHEIDSLSQKASAEQRRMSSGSVANARELDAIGHEIENLKRRIADREDELLTIMERREALEAAAKEADVEAGEQRRRVEQMRASSEAELAKVSAELDERRVQRQQRSALVDPDTLELYEDLRRQKKGVGAAALVDNVCQGCHEQLSAVELDKVRHTEDIPRCEYCRRILVL
jgi:predicted  nucleic acid-binding Zn-ribbon protein